MELEKTVRALPAIADEIGVEVAAVQEHLEGAVAHAIRAGELLIEAKAQVAHGEWMTWLEANFPATAQTAARWMRLARNRQQIESAGSISEALKQLAPAPDGPASDATPPLSRRQAEEFTLLAGEWFAESIAAVEMGDPLPPDIKRPPVPEDHLAWAAYWLRTCERAVVARRRAAKRALVVAAQVEEPLASAYARVGAAGLAYANAEEAAMTGNGPDNIAELEFEWTEALGGIRSHLDEQIPQLVDEVVDELCHMARLDAEYVDQP